MESSDLLCSDACHESSAAVVTLQHLEDDKAYYEQHYRQLTREKEEFERILERERRDRESLETSYREELEERLRCEDKFTDVSGAMAKYERELTLLRTENSHLKTQFGQLRSVVGGRGSTGVALHAGVGGASGFFADHVGTGFVCNGSGGSLPTVSHEMYREEVAILSHENELFKQIIEIIGRQDHVNVEENREIQSLESSEQIIWLKSENSKLEERAREVERNAKEQEISIEREREKAEEDMRTLKREVQSLKNQLEMGTQDLGDYEGQITEIKRHWDEEVQVMQVNLETEVSIKCQLQEQLHLLEMNIRALEEERKTLLDKIELAYKKEDEVISERGVLEDTYSQEISDMQRKLDQASHEKIEAFAEMEKLTNELVEVKTQQGQMEEVYIRDLEEIRLGFEAEKEEFIRHVQQNTDTVQAQTDQAHHLHAGVDNWHVKLEQEIGKRQSLEKENKQLLYQINKILSGADGAFEKGEGGKSECGFVTNTSTISRERNEKVRELEDELTELHEKCRILERDARKKKEFENKIKELMEEIEDLMSKKEEMARKQKELMRAAENSTSNVQEVEDKNRRLEEQIHNLSRKVRDMEDSYKQLGSATKSSEVNELRWENDNLKRTTVELQKSNEVLESKARDVEQQLRELQAVKERIERESVNTESRYIREIDLERSKAESLRQELEKTSKSLKKQASEFERTLEDRKRLYEEHQRRLEDDKQRVKNELENEKESLRRRFEDERRAIEQRVSEVETKLRQQGLSAQDTVLFTCGTSGAVTQQDVVNQQLSFHSNQSNQSAANLRHEVTELKTANELDSKVRDLERKFQREIEDLMSKHEREKRKLSEEMRDSFRTRLEDVKRQYETQIAESSGAETQPALNKETSNFAVKFQREKEDIIRVFEGEKRTLNCVIHSLKKDVCVLKQEKERALIALKSERRNAENRDSTNYENITRMKSEYEERMRIEKEKTHKTTTELRRKITLTEGKVQDIEAKYRDEMKTLEMKYEQQRTELESVIHNTEEQVRIRLQVEYEARLKEERERYEETLKDLRREISALQEQRKQIQLKLKSTDASTKSSNRELRCYNKGVYGRLEYEYTARLSEQKRKLDDRIKDLEQEVQVLKREKAEIKSSYRQEKAQMEAEFEKERSRVEERYRKERDELRKRLDTSQVRVMGVNDQKVRVT